MSTTADAEAATEITRLVATADVAEAVGLVVLTEANAATTTAVEQQQ